MYISLKISFVKIINFLITIRPQWFTKTLKRLPGKTFSQPKSSIFEIVNCLYVTLSQDN